MATEITVPKLGLTMTEANLVKWAVAPGQPVSTEDIVAVIETDKVSFEIAAPAAGLVHPVLEVGTVVAVSQVIGYVAADESELASLRQSQPSVTPAVAAPAETVAQKPAPAPDAKATPSGGRIIASPLARRMAREEGLDLASISGTGPGGRIVEADIKKALAAPLAEKPAPSATAPVAEELLTVAEEIPIQGIRKVIFNNMHNSLMSQAQLTLETEVSAMGMIGLRDFFNSTGDVKISFNAILVKAAARALRQHPMLNSTVDGDMVKIWNEIHVGLAMDLGDGLIVPKVRCADTKSVVDISAGIAALVEKARSKSLGPDDLQCGTFTITNLGAWGVDHFTPIVNFPESAILGVGRMVDKPWAVDGEVKIETRMCLSLTFDHRIIDGAPAAAFFKTLTQMIEEPRLML